MAVISPSVAFRRFGHLSDGDLGAWRVLARSAAEPNPFYEPEMLLAAARHLGEDDLELLTVEAEGRWIAAAPVVRRPWVRPFPGPCLVNWLYPHCYLGTPLLAEGHEEHAARALLEASDDRGAAWLGLREIPEDSPAAAALRAAAEHDGREPLILERRERAVRSADGVAGSATMSSRARADLRRRGRRLGEALHSPVDFDISSAAATEAADGFLELEHTGWKRDAGTSLLSCPDQAQFFRDAAGALGRRMRFFRIDAGGRTAAIASSIAAGDSEFLFKTAYDESLGRFAPGLQAAVGTIDELARAPRYVDSCAASDSEVVNQLLPDRRSIVAMAIPRKGLAGRAQANALELAIQARRAWRGARALRPRRAPGPRR